jgi:hypothetical protein
MCVGVVVVFAKALVSQAALVPVSQSEFGPGAQVVTFETGSTGLPAVPGLTFLSSGPSSSTWYGSSGNFSGFFDNQGWSNTVSTTYGDLGAQFDPTVQAVGGYVGRIPNFTNQHPSQVTVELFNSSLVSLGTASINLPASLNSPVFFGFRADEPIARFRMTGNNTGFFSVDNFTFVPVPEPASPVLVLAGVAMLQMRRRRSNVRSSTERKWG